MKKNVHFVLIFLLHLVLFSETLAAVPPAFEGRKLYVSYCLVCHGVEGKGDGPLAKSMKITPADLRIKIRKKNDNTLRKSITGKSRHAEISEAMPKWGSVFSKSEVSALIAFLRFLSYQQYPLMGNPEVGRKLYKKHCQMCHGKEGDGNGLMKDLINIKPIDHTNAHKTNKLTNDEILKIILEGKGEYMPAWGGILTQRNAEGLVSYIRLLSQTWERLKKGGLVIMVQSIDPTEDNGDVASKSSETTCEKKSVISKSGIQQIRKLSKLFKSRNVPVEGVMASSSCHSKETAKHIFGYGKPPEVKTALSQISENKYEDLREKLEHEIAFWKGKSNLVIVTNKKNIKTVNFKRFDSREFLIVMPMQESGFEVIGTLKY